MANKSIFNTQRGATHRQYGESVATVDTVNEAGGKAYDMTDKHALAQLASTGCFGQTFYVGARDQLDKVKELAARCDSEFLAKLAVYARSQGYMKDMPAVMLGILFARVPGAKYENGDVNPNFIEGEDPQKVSALFRAIFMVVMDNGRMLRNFVQVVRSGALGRKSFGTSGRKMIRQWLNDRSYWKLFQEAVGNDPSMADVIKMARPKPKDAEQRALFGYITEDDRAESWDREALPQFIKDFEAFKKDPTKEVPDVFFERLTALNFKLEKRHWLEIVQKASWFQSLKSLNIFQKNGALDHDEITKILADRLKDLELVKKAKVFPYQIFVAYHAAQGLPKKIMNALQDALEAATENIPAYEGKVLVFPDVSGSMSWGSVTGSRTSSIRCVDVAALITASIMRTNDEAEVYPFDTRLHDATSLNGRDSVATNAEKLSRFGGGGTDCSLPLAAINRAGKKADLVIYVSDNESWVDRGGYGHTGTMEEWSKFKRNNPNAKLVCIDLQPNTSMQVRDTVDILNIGGFSDAVFKVIDAFLRGGTDGEHWVQEVGKTQIG